jgi:hypothetical protein
MEQKLIKSEIESRIFTIRGMQVMLDSDLANLYVTETKFINRAVSRSPDRFPTDFAFRLSNEEWSALRCQNGTLNETLSRGKHRKYSPFAFTEQGIAILSAVLSTPVAIRIIKNTHDRFLILDEIELYHLGASLKDLGKRWFAFSQMNGLVKEILNHLR